MDRLAFALIGAVFGAILAAACWWLYGLAFSFRYTGPGIDPQLTHWVKLLGGVFAALGFLFKDRVGSLAGDAFASIFNFEADRSPTENVSWWQVLFTLVLVAGLIWFLTRN
jgi:hypothetical protein